MPEGQSERNFDHQLPEISKHGYWGPLPGESPELYKALGAPAMERVILDRIPQSWRAEFNMETGRDLKPRPVETSTPPAEPTRQERLERLVTFTQRNEIWHVSSLTFVGIGLPLVMPERGWVDMGLLALVETMNVIGNIPPIIVQRHNRLRAYRLLDKMSRSPATIQSSVPEDSF